MGQILHVDLDAFFASVEELDNPSLKGHPLAVGGSSEHGIVTTANYIARKYGVHSAMPVFMAKKLCPNLLLVPIRRHRYVYFSQEVFKRLKDYSPLIEKVSIDEGYLDLSHSLDPRKDALSIKKRIWQDLHLSLSCGLSYNKFLAKLASDMEKPNGFTQITESQVYDIMKTLPIGKIHGIGRKSEGKLKSIGIETGGDLLNLERSFLEELLGKSGLEIYQRIRGIDERSVNAYRERKSYGTEETFDRASKDPRFLEEKLKEFSQELSHAMVKKGFMAYTLTLKIKTTSFESHSRSKTLDRSFRSKEDIFLTAKELLREIKYKEKLRLMGLTLSSLVNEDRQQLYFL